MAKPKPLVDSFMAGLMKNAKSAVDSVTKQTDTPGTIIPLAKTKDQDQIRNVSVSDQDHIDIGTVTDQEHDRISKVSDTDQVGIRYGSDTDQVKGSSKDQDQNTTPEQNKRITKGSPFTSLSKSQTSVYLWFKQNGETGVFNKPKIERALSMPYITIRKAINKLEIIGLIELSYDGCQKIYEYKLNSPKGLKLAKHINIGSGSYQDHSTIGTGPLISSSSSLKETTTGANAVIETTIAEIIRGDAEYTYWIEQQVSPKQIAKWKNEFGLDLQTILNNLCFVRWQIIKQGTKINKSAADLLYSIMKKNGGTVNKPANYKSMAELDKEYYEEWKAKRLEQERMKQQAQKDEIESKALELLKQPDPENEEIKEAIERIHSLQKRNAITEALKSGKELEPSLINSLKIQLECVLTQKGGL